MIKNSKWGYIVMAILFTMTLAIPVQSNLDQIVPQTFDQYYPSNTLSIDEIGISAVDNMNISMVSEVPAMGMTENVFVDENYAYLANDYGGLVIYDVSDSANPVFVGQYSNNTGITLDVDVKDGIAYLADDQIGLEIVDVSVPSNPVKIAELQGVAANDVFVNGSYAYLSHSSNDLRAVDVSDPYNPVVAGTYPSTAYDIFVSGAYVYLASYNQGMKIVDFSDPASPSLEGTFLDGGRAMGVFVKDSHAFLADGSSGFRIIDISDPTTPVQVVDGAYVTGNYIKEVFVDGDIAYISDETDDMQLIDISNFGDPTLISQVPFYDAYNIFVDGSHAYVSAYDDNGEAGSFYIVDVSDSANPEQIWHIFGGGAVKDTFISGNYAYMANQFAGLKVVDISDKANPIEVGSYYIGGETNGIFVRDSYAYLADSVKGLIIIDISDPANPTLTGVYNDSTSADNVYVNESLAYVAFSGDGLHIVDISNPANPVWKGTFDDGSSTNDVVVEGNYAFVAGGHDGLEIIDVSNPLAPSKIGELYNSGYAVGVAVQDDYAFLADDSDGIEVIDISDLENPVTADRYSSGGLSGTDVYVDGPLIYAASYQGLTIFDATDPFDIVVVGEFEADSYGVTVDGLYIYLSDAYEGFKILSWIEQPSLPLSVELVDNLDRSVTINWAAALVDGGDPLTEYSIYRGLTSDSLNLLATVGSTELTYTDTSPVMGITYYYAVTASNCVFEGNLTDALSITPTSLPTAPQDLSLNLDSDNFVELTWSAPTDTGGLMIANYTINRGLDSVNLTHLVTVSGSVLQYLDDTVECGITYYYSIDVNNTIGDGDTSSTQSITTFDLPSSPINLVLDLDSDNFVELNWDAPNDGGTPISDYTVYRGSSAKTLIELVNLSNSTLDYTDSTVMPGMTYYYAVSAVNEIGEGDLSDTESIITNDYPDAPDIALLFENDNVTISWNASLDGGSAITGYIIYRGLSADNMTELVTVSGSTLAYNDSTVENDETYFYAVSAVNDIGEGDLSTILEITIPGGGSTVIIIVTVVVVAGVSTVVVVKRKGLV